MNKARNRIVSLALAACLLLTMTLVLPGPVAVQAADVKMQEGKPTITRNNTEIAFAGHEWVVIGYNGENGSVYSSGNTATLLLKDGDAGGGFDPVPFRKGQDNAGVGMKYHSDSKYYYAVNPDDPQWTNPNEYRGSTLLQEMESIASNFPSMEQARINARTLTADDDSTNKITGGDVASQLLWPLSYDEWATIGDDTVRAYSAHWWLRSPYSTSIFYGSAWFGSSGDSSRNYVHVDASRAVRPAFQLNLASVLFTSDASGASAKSNAIVGSGLVGASAPSGNAPIKFTMPDTGVQPPTLVLAETTNNTDELRFGYAGAKAGDNQYISCVLVSKNTNNVEYYGKLADCETEASGVFSIPLTGVDDGPYDLKIFCEQANEDLYTDFAGESDDYVLTVGGGTGSVSGGSGSTDNTRPAVDSVVPANTAVDIAVDGNIVITFDKEMYTKDGVDEVALNNSIGVLSGGNWSGDKKTFAVPYTGLAYSTGYNIAISGFQDAAGNEMIADNSYSFTTADAPLNAHDITVTASPQEGGDPVATPTDAAPGDTVKVEAKPNPGWKFTGWSSSPGVTFTDSKAEITTFTMPDSDVAIVAYYTADGTTPTGAAPVITTTTLRSGKVGDAYSETLSATGDAPIIWTMQGGSLPLGFSLSGGGVISGIPTAAGTADFTVKAENAHGAGTKALRIVVASGDEPGTNPGTDPGTNPGTDPSASGGRSSSRSSSSSGGRSTAATVKTAIPASASSWDGRTLVIDYDGVSPLGITRLLWDGEETEAYNAYQGSVIVRFDEDFIAAQKPGEHTVRVEFLNHTAETTVTVDGTGADTGNAASEAERPAAADDNYNPSTGGYPTDGAGVPNTGGANIWPALLLGSLGGAALVWYRRLKIK